MRGGRDTGRGCWGSWQKVCVREEKDDRGKREGVLMISRSCGDEGRQAGVGGAEVE